MTHCVVRFFEPGQDGSTYEQETTIIPREGDKVWLEVNEMEYVVDGIEYSYDGTDLVLVDVKVVPDVD